MASAQAHRFRDKVGVWIGTGATEYFTADEAEALGDALKQMAESIRRESFVDSTCGTFRIPAMEDEG